MEENRFGESDQLNQNLVEGMVGESQPIQTQDYPSNVPMNQNIQYPQFENNPNTYYNYNNINQENTVVYNNQQVLNEKITAPSAPLGPNDIIKVEYEQALFSEFEKIIQYDPYSNDFISGVDFLKPYTYHFNPSNVTIQRYRSCDCCFYLCQCISEIAFCKTIYFYFNLVMDLKNFFSILTALNFVLFIESFANVIKHPNFIHIFMMLGIYGMTLYFESKLLYYQLPPPITIDDFRKKLQAKIQTGQRIFFGDDKKVVPLVYHSYRDISGTVELSKKFSLIHLAGRPGTYFLDGKTIKEFHKLNNEFSIRGGNCKYYIIYEDSPETLNREVNYETQSLNSLFSANELRELAIKEDELIYFAPQGFVKWNTCAVICFFCLVGEVYNNYFVQNLETKYYKIRKAIFFEQPDQEIEEKLVKYSPRFIYQGNVMEFETHSEKLSKNIVKPYFEKWDDEYNEKNVKEYI